MKKYPGKEEQNKKKIYKDISDPVVDAMVNQIQKGDKSVFPELLERCDYLLRKSIYRRFIKGYEREDLFQEACMILVECIIKFDTEKGMSFNQYVCLSLDNHFNRMVRKSNAIKRKSFKDSLSLEGVLEEKGYQLAGSAKAIQPEDKPIMKETMEEYIEYLSLFEKEVCLYFFLGYSYEQIAHEMKCPRQKVMSAKHRCTLKYRENFMQ